MLTDRLLSAIFSAPLVISRKKAFHCDSRLSGLAYRTLRGAPDAPSRSTEEISHAEKPTKST
jgi:hypothetical protein